MLAAALLLSPYALTIPAQIGYVEAGPSVEIGQEGVEGWISEETVLVYGGILSAGTLSLNFDSAIPAGEEAKWQVSLSSEVAAIDVSSGGASQVSFEIEKRGWHTLRLKGLSRSGATFGELRAISLSGSALQNAKFRTDTDRQSPQMRLQLGPGRKLEGRHFDTFCQEIVPQSLPAATRYDAINLPPLTFGLEVSSTGEKYVGINFPQNIVTNPRRIPAPRSFEVIEAHKGVEITKESCLLRRDWKDGEKSQFLVHTVPQGEDAVYSAYYKEAAGEDWELIVKVKIEYELGMHRAFSSILSNTEGASGHLLRRVAVGPTWGRTLLGKWIAFKDKRFFVSESCGVATGYEYGQQEEVEWSYLQTGGFRGTQPPNHSFRMSDFSPTFPFNNLPETL